MRQRLARLTVNHCHPQRGVGLLLVEGEHIANMKHVVERLDIGICRFRLDEIDTRGQSWQADSVGKIFIVGVSFIGANNRQLGAFLPALLQLFQIALFVRVEVVVAVYGQTRHSEHHLINMSGGQCQLGGRSLSHTHPE